MPIVGTHLELSGDVTTLNWISARSPRMIEGGLGFGRGRLSLGYWIAVLKERLGPDDFVFGGTTMRSGGRLGLPAESYEEDALRATVHEEIMAERGGRGYRELQTAALASVSTIGPKRIAKVLPVKRHDPGLSPKQQYPMGGGGLQWKIDEAHKKRFLIALYVDPAGMADAGSFNVSLDNYDARAKVARYLETA
jgi:hypothetical protein